MKINKKKIQEILSVTHLCFRVLLGSFAVGTFGGAIYDSLHEEPCFYEGNKLVLSEEELNNIKKNLKPALEGKVPDESLEDDNIDNYYLLNAVYNNEKIDDELKSQLYQLLPLIENSPDFNKENSYKTLSELRYSFVEEDVDDAELPVWGAFLPGYDLIKIFCKDDTLKEMTINHENIHALFTQSRKNTPSFFREGVTQLLTKEYFTDDPYSIYVGIPNYSDSYVYIPEITMVKLICDLVGSDKVLEAFVEGDITIIYEALSNITGTVADAKVLIDSFENIIEEIEYDNDEYQSICKLLASYRYKKADSIIKDRDMLNIRSCYYNEQIVINCIFGSKDIDDFRMKYLKFVQFNGIWEKAYFCDELKSISSNCRINYEDRILFLDGRENFEEKSFQKTKR